MKKSILILLMLAGCGSKDTDEAEEGGAPANATAVPAEPKGPDPAQLQAIVDRAMPLAIPNADKAQYRNLRAGAGGTVCGEVSTPGARGAVGPFRPFLVTGSGVALVSDRPAIDFTDPNDALADGWIRWCATAAELEALSPTLQKAAGAAAAAPSEVGAMDIPTIDAIPIAPAPAQPPGTTEPAAPQPKAKPAEPPPPPRIDSFFNSVAR